MSGKKPASKSRGTDHSKYVCQNSKVDFQFNIRELPWTQKQQQLIRLLQDKQTKCVLIKGPAGTSKAQPLDSLVLTPRGWTRIGDIVPGDKVITPQNTYSTVTSIHPQGIKQTFRVHFTDGSFADCTDDHLWNVRSYNYSGLQRRYKKMGWTTRGGGWQTLPLSEIRDNLYTSGKKRQRKWSIPIADAIEFEQPVATLPLDPYLLGALIGDGGIKTQVIFSSKDTELVERIRTTLSQYDCSINRIDGSVCDYRITGNLHRSNRVIDSLREMKLFGSGSYDKFIPRQYLTSSLSQRMLLLNGLLDTDGWVNKRTGVPLFCTTSEQLARDVTELVQSLGGIATQARRTSTYTYKGEKRIGAMAYVLAINLPTNAPLFLLERKQSLLKPRTKYFPARHIDRVEQLDQRECVCIKIDDPNELYITDNYVVTHNTIVAVYAALKALLEKKISEVVYIRAAVESSSQSLGHLPGEIGDKMGPYTVPFEEKLSELLEGGTLKRLSDDNRLQTYAINYLRGLHFAVKGIIVDEAQNATLKELVTIITRMGEFSKLIVCGDPKQSDLKNGNKHDFEKLIAMFSDQESQDAGIHVFEFTKEDIVRSEFVKFVVGKLEQHGYGDIG